jgi:heptosyltransferase-2
MIRLIDTLGGFFISKKKRAIDKNQVSSVCFVQLAHIGDFILTLPTLYAFKKNTNKKVFVAVNSENKKLAESLSWIDKVYVVEHPCFDRNKKSYRNTIKQLQQIQADVIFELRGDIRIIPLIKLFASYHHLIGYDAGGGGFLLNKVLKYPFEKHIVETYRTIFALFDIKHVDPLQEWDINVLPHDPLDIGFKNYICINVGVGGRAKTWEREKFIELTQLLSKAFNIVLIGKIDLQDLNYYMQHFINNGSVINLINRTSVNESMNVVKNASLYVGLDTGFTHIATLLGKRVLALYSDASDVAVWKPLELYSDQLDIIKKRVPCGHCGKLNCENNVCMKKIEVNEVFQKICEMMSQRTTF